jgi:hypothetical protein
VFDCDQGDEDVAGEVEMDWEQEKFIQRHEVVWRDEGHMEDEDECSCPAYRCTKFPLRRDLMAH